MACEFTPNASSSCIYSLFGANRFIDALPNILKPSKNPFNDLWNIGIKILLKTDGINKQETESGRLAFWSKPNTEDNDTFQFLLIPLIYPNLWNHGRLMKNYSEIRVSEVHNFKWHVWFIIITVAKYAYIDEIRIWWWNWGLF